MNILENFKALFHNEPNKLIEYLYVDEKRLNTYSEQIGTTSTGKKQGVIKLGWSPTGPSIGGEGSLSQRDTNTHERIQKLLKFLEKKELLLSTRPANSDESDLYRSNFFLENAKATKLIFSKVESIKNYGFKELALWVINPVNKPTQRSRENIFKADGVFLYLIESYWEKDDSYSGPVSGNSALNILLREMQEKFGLDLNKIKEQLYSREDDTPPIKLLEQAGFIVQSPRLITSLYRQRYFSDDQYVNIGGILQRCYDLFAYPIFISSQE